MAEGNVSTGLDLVIEVMTEKAERLEALKKKLEGVKQKVEEMRDSTFDAGQALRESGKAGEKAGNKLERSFSRVTGAGLALLFVGRFLSKTFGGLSQDMLDLVGVSDIVDGVIKGVLAPTFADLVEPVADLAEMFHDLDEDTKSFIATAVIILAVLGAILQPVGLAIAAFAGLSGVISASLAASLGVAAGLIMLFIGAFAAGFAIVKRFGKRVGTIIVIVGLLVAAIASAPVIVVAALGLVAGAAWAMRDDIVEAVGNIIDWITDLPSKIKSIVSDVASAGKDIASSLIDSFIDTVKGSASKIKDAVMGVIPDIGLGGVGSSVGGSLPSFGVNDFVMTGDRLLKTHPNDVIFGTKEPGKLGGGGDNITINVDSPQVREDKDIDRIVREVEKSMDRRTSGRSSIR